MTPAAVKLIHQWAQAKWPHWIRQNSREFAKANGLTTEHVVQHGLEVAAGRDRSAAKPRE